VIARYYKELLSFCTRALKDRDAAADLVQETYTRLLAAEHAGETIAAPRALLYRTAKNLMVDLHRRDETRAEQSIETVPEQTLMSMADTELSPEQAYVQTQHVKAMMLAIDSLPPRCKEAFMLNRFEGLTQQEVADQMGISRNMVAQHIIRGMLTCKAYDDAFHGRKPSTAPDVK
jgi:RNA polymerase sigma factor (sigma-70 family)